MLRSSSFSSAVSQIEPPVPCSWCPAVPLNIRAGMHRQSGTAAARALMHGCNVPSRAWHTAAGPPCMNVKVVPRSWCMEGTARTRTLLLAPLPHPSSTSAADRHCPCPFPKHGPRKRWKPGGIDTDTQQSCLSPPRSLNAAGGSRLRSPQLASERGACTACTKGLRGARPPARAPLKVPGSSPPPQARSLPCCQPTRRGAGAFHLGSFILVSAGAAKPAPELIESHIRARDGER